jgi:hypothetical protein
MFPQNQPLCPTVQALQKETNILFIMEPSTAPSGDGTRLKENAATILASPAADAFRDIQARIESSD